MSSTSSSISSGPRCWQRSEVVCGHRVIRRSGPSGHRLSDLGRQIASTNIHTLLRSLCTSASYFSEDRPDVSCACKDIVRLMSELFAAGWGKIKRLGRYVAGEPRLIQRLERHEPPRHVLALSDSDHAGCLRSRRSTSCTILMHGCQSSR